MPHSATATRSGLSPFLTTLSFCHVAGCAGQPSLLFLRQAAPGSGSCTPRSVSSHQSLKQATEAGAGTAHRGHVGPQADAGAPAPVKNVPAGPSGHLTIARPRAPRAGARPRASPQALPCVLFWLFPWCSHFELTFVSPKQCLPPSSTLMVQPHACCPLAPAGSRWPRALLPVASLLAAVRALAGSGHLQPA